EVAHRVDRPGGVAPEEHAHEPAPAAPSGGSPTRASAKSRSFHRVLSRRSWAMGARLSKRIGRQAFIPMRTPRPSTGGPGRRRGLLAALLEEGLHQLGLPGLGGHGLQLGLLALLELLLLAQV